MTDKNNSNGTDGGMDGAVAAIRRIFQTGADEEADVFLLTRHMMDPSSYAPMDDEDTPLVLTPDMLADDNPHLPAEGFGDGLGDNSRNDGFGGATPVPAQPAGRPLTRERSALDEAAVERIARRIFREELTGNGAEASSGDVRRIIRMEVERLLTGQTTNQPPNGQEAWRTGEDSNPRPPDS